MIRRYVRPSFLVLSAYVYHVQTAHDRIRNDKSAAMQSRVLCFILTDARPTADYLCCQVIRNCAVGPVFKLQGPWDNRSALRTDHSLTPPARV